MMKISCTILSAKDTERHNFYYITHFVKLHVIIDCDVIQVECTQHFCVKYRLPFVELKQNYYVPSPPVGPSAKTGWH